MKYVEAEVDKLARIAILKDTVTLEYSKQPASMIKDKRRLIYFPEHRL